MRSLHSAFIWAIFGQHIAVYVWNVCSNFGATQCTRLNPCCCGWTNCCRVASAILSFRGLFAGTGAVANQAAAVPVLFLFVSTRRHTHADKIAMHLLPGVFCCCLNKLVCLLSPQFTNRNNKSREQNSASTQQLVEADAAPVSKNCQWRLGSAPKHENCVRHARSLGHRPTTRSNLACWAVRLFNKICSTTNCTFVFGFSRFKPYCRSKIMNSQHNSNTAQHGLANCWAPSCCNNCRM